MVGLYITNEQSLFVIRANSLSFSSTEKELQQDIFSYHDCMLLSKCCYFHYQLYLFWYGVIYETHSRTR